MKLLHIINNSAILFLFVLAWLKATSRNIQLETIILYLLHLVILLILTAWYSLTLSFANHKVYADISMCNYTT